MHPWHFHSKPPMTRPVGRHCRRPAARASPCREASPLDKWLLIKHAPVGVQHDLVDFALVASERSGDRPGARDVAGVAVQLAPRIHQQQLPLVHPLRAFNTGLIIRVPSEHVRPCPEHVRQSGLENLIISAGGTWKADTQARQAARHVQTKLASFEHKNWRAWSVPSDDLKAIPHATFRRYLLGFCGKDHAVKKPQSPQRNAATLLFCR